MHLQKFLLLQEVLQQQQFLQLCQNSYPAVKQNLFSSLSVLNYWKCNKKYIFLIQPKMQHRFEAMNPFSPWGCQAVCKIPASLFCLFLNKCKVYYWVFSNGRGCLWLLSNSSCSLCWNSPSSRASQVSTLLFHWIKKCNFIYFNTWEGSKILKSQCKACTLTAYPGQLRN